MSGWKRLYPKPAGSLPGGIVTQWGVALITVLLLVFIGMWLASGGGEETALETAVADVAAPARNFAGQMAAAVEAEAMRAETRRSAAERAMQAQQRQEALEAGSAIGPGQVRLDEARLLAGASPDTGEAYTEEEWELRERLRLEALERRARSLRSSPVAQTYRQLDRGAANGGAEDAQGNAATAIRAEGAEAIAQALGTFEGVTDNLEDDIAAEAEADRAFLAALTTAGTGASGGQESGAGREAGVPGGPLMPSGRAGITTIRRGGRHQTIRRDGSGSMKAPFLKGYWSPSYPVTSLPRCWPRLPCRFTVPTGNGFSFHADRVPSERRRQSPGKIRSGWPWASIA